MVNITLLFTTNEMILISRSQIFRSSVVIFHLLQAYGVLSLSLFDTPGFSPRINVLFWGPGDFSVSYSNRDASWNAWNCPSGSFMVDTGSYLTIWSLPLRKVKLYSDPWPVTVTSHTNQTYHQFHNLDTELDLHRITSGFHGTFATGVACHQGTLTLPETWFRPTFWDLLMLQMLRQVFPNLSCLFSTFHLQYPSARPRFRYFFTILIQNYYSLHLFRLTS